SALLVVGDYGQAVSEVTPTIMELEGNDNVGEQVDSYGDLGLSVARAIRINNIKNRAYVDAFALNEKAMIPFVDEPPVVYPDSEVWRRLSEHRLQRYGAVELDGDNESERRIYQALDN